MTTTSPQPLVRSARDGDIDRICEIIGVALEPEDADEARIVLNDPAFDRNRWLVAESDGAVHSTLAIFDHGHLEVGAARLEVGEIEFVATSEAAQGSGLVRAQMAEAHRRSAAAGHLAQLIVGIPNFYRQFGYSYAIRHPGYHTVPPEQGLMGDATWTPRPAGPGDVDTVITATETALADIDVTAAHAAPTWRWMMESPNYVVVTGASRGQVSVGRIYADDDTAWLGDVVAPTKGALHGLIAAARRIAPEVAVIHNTSQATVDMLDELGTASDELGWYYVRIGDPAAFLDGLRPELERRLAGSVMTSDHLTLSLFRSSLSFQITGSTLGDVTVGPAMPYPVSEGASGIPADLLPDLVLGPHGAAGLESLHGDVLLGDQRDIMETLFPPRRSAIQTWIFP